MGTRKCILFGSVLVVWLISGYSAHSLGTNGRSAKILEDPIVHQASSYEVLSSNDSKGSDLQDTSDRSLSVEHNMMLYRSVFTLSLKLLTFYLIVKLITTAGAGVFRSRPGGPFGGQPNMLYTVDVNHNPAVALQQEQRHAGFGQGQGLSAQGQGLTEQGQGFGGQGQGLAGQGQGSTIASGNTLSGGAGLTATSTGAAAGAYTGTAPGALAPVPASFGGYLSAASTNSRPSFLFPRFRFGGPRHPPLRRPQYVMPPHYVSHHMGEETHLIDTHSHLFVMPDGSQARIPIGQTAVVQQTKPTANAVSNSVPATASSNTASQSTSTTSNSQAQQDSKSSASSTNTVTEIVPVETVSISTSSSSSSSATAERRSSNVFKEKVNPSQLHQLQHQPYDDWNLHFSPGA